MRHDDAKRALTSFSIASFLNDLGSDAVKPFWPMFVTGVLGAPASILGLLDGIGDAISYASRLPAGWLSDRLGKRKPMIWTGYTLAGFSRIGYALSPAVGWLFPFKAMDRLGKMRDPPRDALLADVTPKKHRGRAFGTLTAMDNLGATLGPLFGLLLFGLLGYRWLFALAALPSLIGAALVLSVVHEHRGKGLNTHPFRSLTNSFWRFAVLNALFALGWISLSFMVLSATATGRIPVAVTPLLFLAMSLCAVGSSAATGRLIDRVGRKPMLVVASLLFAATMAGFLALESSASTGIMSWILAFALFALYGIHYGAFTTAQPAFAVELLSPGMRAFGSGIYQSIFGFATLIASTLAGVLWQFASPATAFMYAAIIASVASAAFVVFLKR
ncbi:MFS transporter [Candidatus Woesearchaeota archaeon]|nr:MFS transporter [Candidatus Woesearchaeota archaeon]